MQVPASKLNRASKLVLTFLAIPVAPALAFWGFFTIAYPPHPTRLHPLQENIAASFFLFVIAYTFAGAHVLILGIPAFLIGNRLKAIHWWTCLLASFAIGGLPMSISGGWDWSGLLLYGALGMMGGLVFWLLWRFWIPGNEQS